MFTDRSILKRYLLGFILMLLWPSVSMSKTVNKVDTNAIILTAKIKAIGANEFLVKDVNHLSVILKQTSFQILNSKGFGDNVIFIKVKMRYRFWIEYFLSPIVFDSTELGQFLMDPSNLYFDTLRKSILQKKYGIVDSTQNDILERLLPLNSNYFDTNVYKGDYFFCCVYDNINDTKFYLIDYKATGIMTPKPLTFKNVLLSKSIFSEDVRDMLYEKEVNSKNIQRIKDKLSVEEIDLAKIFLQNQR